MIEYIVTGFSYCGSGALSSVLWGLNGFCKWEELGNEVRLFRVEIITVDNFSCISQVGLHS